MSAGIATEVLTELHGPARADLVAACANAPNDIPDIARAVAPNGLLYLEVDDIDAAVARGREMGADVESEPHVIFGHEDDTLGPAGTDEWQAFLRDSEGNLVGLVEQRPRG